jgi:hypothetical protein
MIWKGERSNVPQEGGNHFCEWARNLFLLHACLVVNVLSVGVKHLDVISFNLLLL